MTEHFLLKPSTGDMKIPYGGRTVFDAAGRMVVGLPAANDFVATGVTHTFPDFQKNWLYNWRWTSIATQSGLGASHNIQERYNAYIAAKAERTVTTTVLASAPAGCNFIFGHIRINRTNTPTIWLNNITAVKPPTNVWIPIGGSNSVLLEEQLGYSRSISVLIQDGSLVLITKQTVSVPPWWAVNSLGSAANIRTMGYDLGDSLPSFSTAGLQYFGGEWAVQDESHGSYLLCRNLGGALLSVYSATQVQGYMRRTTASMAVGGFAGAVTDTTDYHGDYVFDFNLRFGRAA